MQTKEECVLNRVYAELKKRISFFKSNKLKKIVRNGFAEAQTQLDWKERKNEKTMLLSLVIFHFCV